MRIFAALILILTSATACAPKLQQTGLLNTKQTGGKNCSAFTTANSTQETENVVCNGEICCNQTTGLQYKLECVYGVEGYRACNYL